MSVAMPFAVLDPRKRSLLRGTTLVVGSLALALVLTGFPDARPSLKLVIPTVIACFGTWDTVRCLQHRWTFYHAAVVLFLYMDVLALSLILFLLLYPFARWLQ